MTETTARGGRRRGRQGWRRAPARKGQGPDHRAHLHHAGGAPLRRGDLGASRRRPDQLADRRDDLRAAGRGVPRLLVGQRLHDRHDQVLPRRGRHRRSASGALRQLIDRVVLTYVKARQGARLLRHRRRRRDLRARAHLGAAAPGVQLQLARCGSTSARRRRSRSAPASSSPSTTRWTRSSNWYREEGLIFKGGSGAGLNLSRIRSSKELLSSGGTASGPVSFMRGADASAGTIKSGGATRRAAKMVVLDVDHPDIEEFVETKAREEDKIRVAARRRLRHGPRRQATSPASSTRTPTTRSGSATSSCARSRTARDVRPARPHDRRGHRDGRRPRAVRQDRQGGVGVRRPGHPVRRHDQRLAHQPRDRPDHRVQPVLGVHEPGQLLLQPGLAEPAEVPDATTTRFDAATFAKVVELVITAMDISICFADFPTEAIGETTRAYRQLGIGYANLGALLMATGHGLRLRRRPGAGRLDHLADDRYGVQALRRAGRRRRPVRGLRPQRRGARAGHAQARRGQRRRSARMHTLDKDVQRRRDQGVAGVPARRRAERLAQRAGLACSPRPARSAS